MFRFSRKMIFCVEAVLYIALHGLHAPVQSRAVTRRQNIPERYLEQALQSLVRVGILRGVRGPRGGYQLARPAERISVGEIVAVIRSIEGYQEGDELEIGSQIGREVVMPIFERLDSEIMERLDRISIAELVRQSGEQTDTAEFLSRQLEAV